MPLIEFIGPNGERVERLLNRSVPSIQERGRVYHRSPVHRFALSGVRRDQTQAEKVFAGYYREECRGGRFRSKFTKAQIKRAWAKPLKDGYAG